MTIALLIGKYGARKGRRCVRAGSILMSHLSLFIVGGVNMDVVAATWLWSLILVLIAVALIVAAVVLRRKG